MACMSPDQAVSHRRGPLRCEVLHAHLGCFAGGVVARRLRRGGLQSHDHGPKSGSPSLPPSRKANWSRSCRSWLVSHNVASLVSPPRSGGAAIEVAHGLAAAVHQVAIRYRFHAHVVLCLLTGIRTEVASGETSDPRLGRSERLAPATAWRGPVGYALAKACREPRLACSARRRPLSAVLGWPGSCRGPPGWRGHLRCWCRRT